MRQLLVTLLFAFVVRVIIALVDLWLGYDAARAVAEWAYSQPNEKWIETFRWLVSLTLAALFYWLYVRVSTRKTRTRVPTNDAEAATTDHSIKAPEPSEYSAEEIARALTALHSREYSADQVRRMYENRGFDVRREVIRFYPKGSGDLARFAMDISGHHERKERFWIRSEDRERFERGESTRISLRDAAFQFHEAVCDTIQSELLDRMDNTQVPLFDDPYARALIMEERNCAIPLFGKRVPFSTTKQIPAKHIEDATFVADDNSIVNPYNDFPAYSDVEINRRDFETRKAHVTAEWRRRDGNG